MIPEWGANGLLPPIIGNSPTSMTRSPYQVEITEFVERFTINKERFEIAYNFIKFRETLREIGIVEGFQWINGSFVENTEILRDRTPHDIDVVTFYNTTKNNISLYENNQDIFNHRNLKNKFKVDGYFVSLSQLNIKNVIYWYSLCSHTREMTWKGFIQINLVSDDYDAKIKLEKIYEDIQHV